VAAYLYKNTMEYITLIILVSVGFLIQGCVTTGEGRHERHARIAEESGQPVQVSGGQSFQTAMAYDATLESIVTFLKKKDYSVESANKETGQITTVMSITGGWRQTGTRVQVTLIKESDTATTVKVAVTEQQRYKALQVEPWDDPKVNADSSAALAAEMKTGLQK